jgi:nucleoside-diphosphate-sugar epimerase
MIDILEYLHCIRATGFIGLPAAQALSRAGYQVYGLARSEAKAKLLAENESQIHTRFRSWYHLIVFLVIPVLGEASDTKTWIHLIPTLDVVIEALGGSDGVAISDVAFEAVKAAAGSRPAGSSKLTYVYTSGTWVHGDRRNTGDIVSDTTPLISPADLVSWRPAKEQRVVKDDVLNGIVVRPAVLYGRSGSILAPLFADAAKGKVRWPGRPGGRMALIHTDDLADLYVRVAERAQAVGGLIFDAANDFTESVQDVLTELVRVSGAQGSPEIFEPTNGEGIHGCDYYFG